MSRGLKLPELRSVEWRLQARLGGRFEEANAPPEPEFLLRLLTGGGDQGEGTETMLTADPTMMRRLTSELEAALAEEKSTHSRRIARRT